FWMVPMALSLRQKLTIISLLIYWPTIFVLAHIPIPEVVEKAAVSDKSLHFLAHLILVFLLWFAICPDRRVNWRGAVVWLILLTAIGYGGADELLQRYVGRTCAVTDFLANVVGAFAGLILVTFFTFWRGLLVVTALAVFLLTNLARVNPAELLPVTSTVFYVFAYAFLTALWVQYVRLFWLLKAPQAKWLIAAIVPPVGFLAIVKLFSTILDKPFEVRSVLLSAGGIAVVVLTVYVVALFRWHYDQVRSNGT
ncbi:MAG: VanZ family protein, partial [Planctomycetota bacterium]